MVNISYLKHIKVFINIFVNTYFYKVNMHFYHKNEMFVIFHENLIFLFKNSLLCTQLMPQTESQMHKWCRLQSECCLHFGLHRLAP